jgi:excinuclease ABC subunit A
VVVDRLVKREGIERRLTDSLETALGWPTAWPRSSSSTCDGEGRRPRATTHVLQHLACPNDGTVDGRARAPQLLVQLALRRLRECDGLGTRFEVDPELVVPDPDLSLGRAPSQPWAGAHVSQYFSGCSSRVAEELGFDLDTRGRSSPRSSSKALLHGTAWARCTSYKNRYGRVRSYSPTFEGVVPYLERRHTEAESDTSREQIEGYMREVPCPACGGARLKPVSLAVTHRRARTSPRSARCRSARRPSSSPASS